MNYELEAQTTALDAMQARETAIIQKIRYSIKSAANMGDTTAKIKCADIPNGYLSALEFVGIEYQPLDDTTWEFDFSHLNPSDWLS